MVELTSTSDPNLTLMVAEDGQSCKATLKVSTVPSSVRRALGAYFDYLPLTVTFNGNGATSGSMASITDMNIDSSFNLGANGFTKTGYSFSNWTNDLGMTFNNNASVTGNSFWDSTMWNFHSVLTAVWTPNTYTVTFNGNGGSTPSPKTVTYDSKYGTLPSPTWTGYTFAGWWTAASGGSEVKADTKVQITAAQTLYAHWTANRYTVRHHKNDGSGVTKDKSFTYDVGDHLYWKDSELGWSRPGYNWLGWATSSSGSVVYRNGQDVTNLTSVADAVVNIYSIWKAFTYKITVVPNGGTGGGDGPKYTISANQQQKTITLPTRTGYSITGWTVTGATGGTPTVSGSTLTIPANAYGDLTLTPNWTANGYTVTFNGNGGSTPSSKSVTYDSTYGTLPSPTRTGYTFAGWWTAASGGSEVKADTKVQITAAQTLYAHWTANKYTVRHHKNDGSGVTKDKSFTYDVGDKLYWKDSQLGWSRLGYNWLGWATSSSGAVVYGNGQDVTNLTSVADAVVNIYSIWKAVEYQIKVVPNGGTGGSGPNYTISANQQQKTITLPTRTGYSITGWTVTGATGGTPTVSGSTLTIPANAYGNLTLTPTWAPVVYNITYNGLMEGSTHTNPSTYTIPASDIVFTPATDPSGYKFNGWTPASIAKGSTGNKTVTAKYLTITYKPAITSPITYSGYSQACARPGTGVTAQGNEATEVGTYTATFTPISGYCWSDGTKDPYVVNWQIKNAAITDILVSQSDLLTYTGEPLQPTVITRATTKGWQAVTWKYSTSQGNYTAAMPSFTDAGTYTVYFEATAPNHDPAYGSFTVMVNRAKTATVVVSPTGLPYTRKEQGPAVTLQHCHEEAGSVKRATDVGTYAVKATPDANYAWSDGDTAAREFAWSIDDSLYTVLFDRNGGAGEMASTNLAYNEEYVVPECLFTKTGCEFQSWQMLIDNRTVTNYPAGTVVSNLTTTAGKVVTFKADWLGRYTIAFDANGGEGMMASTNVERDVGFQLPSNAFTRTGYDFTTWTMNLSASAKPADLIADGATVTNLVAAGETCTLHALWDPHHYTVIFDANGGTGSVPVSTNLAYDESMPVPASSLTPPLHYEFTGWGTDPMQKDGTYQPNESVSNLTAVADGQVTLYAIWKFIESSISEALDIDSHDLYFENGSRMVTPWSIDYERYCREDTSASSMLHLGDNGQIVATAKSAGTLSFWWMGEFEEDPWTGEQKKQTTLLVECNGGTMTNNCVESFNMEWQKVEIRILAPSDITFYHSGTSRCWVDHVVWTPDGGGEPTRGDPVAVTAAGITDGVFALTIPTVSGTDYGVWTNADLTVDSWGLMGEPQKGEGEPLEFKWTILPGFPQLFFRAHKVEYK